MLDVNNWTEVCVLQPGDWASGWGLIIATAEIIDITSRPRITFLANGSTIIYEQEFHRNSRINIIRRGE
jgi:hypothetical protein